MTGLVTDTLGFDGGRRVTAYVPDERPEAIVFAGDGAVFARWQRSLDAAHVRTTMLVGVQAKPDETARLHEYSPVFDPDTFDAHESFFVDDVRRWAEALCGVSLPRERTAVFGASAGGELALALALRHPDIYGSVLCASPGAGYRPTPPLPQRLPRAYFVAGTQEPFFLENAVRWADALRDGGAEVVMAEREGRHGGAFWEREFPLMIGWLLAG